MILKTDREDNVTFFLTALRNKMDKDRTSLAISAAQSGCYRVKQQQLQLFICLHSADYDTIFMLRTFIYV